MPHKPLTNEEKLTQITDKEAELQPLYSRQEVDKDLYQLKKFKLTVGGTKDPVPHVENVTLNDPRTFADRVISILTGATRTIIIKSEMLDDDEKAMIKDFLDDVNVEIDVFLEQMGHKTLDNIAFSQLALRGWVATRFESRMKGKKYIPDTSPWDSRWTSWEHSVDGFAWAAYRSARSKWLIHEQYGFEFVNTPVEVIDRYENNGVNIIYIGGNQHIVERNHGFKKIPVIIQKATSGAFLRDSNSLANDGESIFAAARDLFPEKNKMMTIMQTLTVASFFGGLQYKGKEGEDMTEKPQLPPYGLRFVVPVDKDGGYSAMPVTDIHNATRLGFNILETAIQRATFPPTEFGSIEFPMSAVGLVELGQGRDDTVLPIADGWARFRRRLAEMTIDQFIEKNMTATFGHSGRPQRTYTAADLKKHQGKYEIVYKFTNVSNRDRIAKIEMARAVPDKLMSQDTKRRDILEMENPDAEQDKLNIQNAIELIPEFQLYEYGRSLLKQEPPNEIGARIIAEKLNITLEQLESGRFVPPETLPPEQVAESIVPLTGGGTANRKSSLDRQAEINAEVREPV